MGFIPGLFTVVLVLDCLLLIFLVLIQLPKKEAGAGLAFGGAAGGRAVWRGFRQRPDKSDQIRRHRAFRAGPGFGLRARPLAQPEQRI